MVGIVKILSVGLVFFINVFLMVIEKVKSVLNNFLRLILVAGTLLFNYEEKDIIVGSLKKMTYPSMVAFILNKTSSPEFLPKIIKWALYTKSIKHILFYDPFKKFDNDEEILKFMKALNHFFHKNFSIGLTANNQAYNVNKGKEINKAEIFSYNFDIIISIIDFNSANADLLNRIKNKNDELFPKQINFYNGKNKKKDFFNHEYEKYYTRKKVIGLPELVICFDREEICLYGFPFSLLENCEISQTKKSIENFDVFDFVNVFTKYARINKRFGY